MKGTRLAWLVVVVLAALPFVAHAARRGTELNLYSGEAFAAFYCAGEAVREHSDPYLVEPLRSCEARANVIPRGVAEPAPLPPLTLAFFSLFSLLPYGAASIAWAIVLIACSIAAGRMLVSLAPRVPPIAIYASLLPGIVYANGVYGETPALVVAALAFAGLGLRSGRMLHVVAGVTVATLFEPHVGSAAWLGVLIFVPRARALLVLVLLAAVADSALMVGYHTSLSYVTKVLPLHAASEFVANDQLSLTTILYQLGVPGKEALVAGSLSYALALAAGLAVARMVAREAGAPEFLVFLPAAAVLFGGTFIHDSQMGLAIPLAVAAANVAKPRLRWLAYLGLLAGAVPESHSGSQFVLLGAGAAFAAAWAACGPAAERSRLSWGSAGALTYVAVALVVRGLGQLAGDSAQAHYFATSFPAAPAGAIAEASWAAYVTAISHVPTVGEQLSHALQYATLVATYASASLAGRALGVRRAKSTLQRGNSPV